jgi:hypothetical protein
MDPTFAEKMYKTYCYLERHYLEQLEVLRPELNQLKSTFRDLQGVLNEADYQTWEHHILRKEAHLNEIILSKNTVQALMERLESE